jgi:hypothetical protein
MKKFGSMEEQKYIRAGRKKLPRFCAMALLN